MNWNQKGVLLVALLLACIGCFDLWRNDWLGALVAFLGAVGYVRLVDLEVEKKDYHD